MVVLAVLGRGQFRKQRAGRGFYSVVEAEVRLDQSASILVACPLKTSGGSQGSVVELNQQTAVRYEEALRLGTLFGLAQANLSHAAVTIRSLSLRPEDSTQTSVAVAAVLAVWNAVNHTPETLLLSKLEDLVFSSAGAPEVLPDFGRLTSAPP